MSLPGYLVIAGLGPMELVIILVVVLIIFGPSQLPKIGHSLGRFISDFRKEVKNIEETTSFDDEDDSTSKREK
jgi:sec-independent protein translocase protein TatA